MNHILLDPDGNALIPSGYLLIDTETAFLENATSKNPMFIRGRHLCAWAETFFSGRNIPTSDAYSPIRDLVGIFTGLTIEQAEYICNTIGNSLAKIEKLSASAILNACFPIPIWDSAPSKKHVAEWLLWLVDKEPNAAFLPILRAMTEDWRRASPDLSDIYQVHDPSNARILLGKWLGETITPFLEKFGEFPLPVPLEWIAILNESWRKEITKTNGTFFDRFLKSPTPWHFKQIVALATLDYFEKYPDGLTHERHDQIARFISGEDRARLKVLKQASKPVDVPDEPELVLNWFEKEYLPFREWQFAARAEKSYPRVLELGQQFAKWYLDFYPKALTSKKYLSFFKSKDLKDQDSDYVDLLIILDGLQAIDAKILLDALLKSNGSQRLVMIENSLCFAPLPTVTDFAKGALVHGVQPTLMKELELLGEDVSERQTPLLKLQAAHPGDLFIWRIQDPDRIYHTKNNSPMLKTEVEGELSTIAKKINDVVEKLIPAIPLKIIITTDHGRFLGVSNRIVDVPQGMQAHGRAAWGRTNIQFDKTGYRIEDDLVYLSRDRFGLLSDDAAVILSDSAFRHEKYEKEISTHGGLFPEEVVIPWMVFERNIERPNIEFAFSGAGRATLPGKIIVSTINPSTIDLDLTKAEINFGGDMNFSFELMKNVPGLKKTEFEIDITTWPSSEQVSLGKANFTLRLPSGEEFGVSTSLVGISVTELYTRDKSILEGLDL
ncbi:MAG: hypothetical protein JW704_11045 [Anaerolineaceae bacterium]|nr:hypothetical protein [Anaerolineaceae bacterium]MBN2678362.1 hypothetical protein [Anaerolineaceae bacterium]